MNMVNKTAISWKFLLIIIGLLAVGCGNEAGKNGDAENTDSLASNSSEKPSGNDVKVYALPAPLQVATALKMLNTEFSDKFLLPSKNSKTNYSSNYLRALNLGIYTVDLGYVTVFERKQTSLDYVKSVQTLMKDLGVGSGIKPDLVKRFEDNMQHQDSLYRIILQSYNNAHAYFQDNKREDVGMFILCGGFIEGLYLTLNNKDILTNNKIQNIVGQHKLFYENILELLKNFDASKDAKDLAERLNTLKAEYEDINVIYDNSLKGKVITKCSVDSEQIKKLLTKVTALRNKIVNA